MATPGSMAGIAALPEIVPPSEGECVRRYWTRETLVRFVGWMVWPHSLVTVRTVREERCRVRLEYSRTHRTVLITWNANILTLCDSTGVCNLQSAFLHLPHPSPIYAVQPTVTRPHPLRPPRSLMRYRTIIVCERLYSCIVA